MPFDPTLSTNPALRKQAAPQIAAQADHERQVLRQQAEQKRAEAQAAREAEKMQNEAAKAQQQQANIDAETTFRAAGREFFTDAAGNIVPTVDDATHNAQQAAAKQRADQEIQYKQEGRKFTKNALTGDLVPLESDAILEQRRQKEADDLRRESLLGQMQSIQAEAALRANPLRDKERTALEKQLKETRNGARFALAPKLQEKAKAVTGGADYIPFNEAPAPEAESAKARLERLMQPDAQLDDTDLADLEADPTTAPTVAQLRSLQDKLAADDEARSIREQTGQTLKELALRRADPAKWETYQREKLAKLDGPALDAHLATSDEALMARTNDLAARQQALMAPQQQWQQKRSELEQQNAQAKASGIPAGELVTLSDGSAWHRPLAKELFDIQAQSQAHEGDPEVAKQKKLIEIEVAELKREAKLRDEAAALRQQKGQAKQEAFHQRLEANPSTAPFSKTLRGLSQEHEARAAVVAEMYPQDSPERQAAMKAIEDDVGTRQQQTQKELQTTVQAKATASAALFEQFGKNPQVNWEKEKDYGLVQNMTAAAAKLGLSEKEARYWLKFHKTADWSQPLTPEQQPTGWSGALDTLTAPLKKGVSAIVNGTEAEKDPARILPDGTLIINPSLHSTQAGYDAAVQASPATPEAKEAAKADFPRLQIQWAGQMLPALADEAAIPGLPSFMKWREAHISRDQARKGADGFTRKSPEEHALQYMQEMQSRPGWAKYADSLTRRFIKAGGDVGTMFTGAAALASGWVPGFGQALSEGTAAWNQENSRNVSALSMKGGMDSLGLRTSGLLAELVPQVGSMIVGGTLLKGGMKTAAAIAGAQSAGLQFAGTYAQRRESGQSHEEAYMATAPFALASGLVTVMLTAAGGRYGPDALAMSKALRDKAIAETVRGAWRQQWPRISAAATVGTHAGAEILEELPDELFSQLSEALATNPNAKLGDVIADFIAHSPELMLAVGALGGVSGVGEARDAYQPQETTAPDLFPAAYEAVENLGALPGVLPEEVEPMKNRAAVALAIAKGGSVEDMEEWQLNAAGWTGRNSKGQTLPPGQIEALKDYTGPEVLEVDTEGNATISPTYLATLEAHLPAAHAAIVGAAPSSSPTQASSASPSPQVSSASVSPSSPLSPEPAQSAQKPAAPTGTPDTQQPRGSSAQGAAPATVDAGGETQAGAGAVSPAPAAGSMQEARAQALAVILEERGLTAEQAQAAAQHVVARQGVQGATAEAQYAAGIDDAMREKNWIRGSGKKYTFVPPTPDAQPETVSPPVASQNGQKPGAESPSEKDTQEETKPDPARSTTDQTDVPQETKSDTTFNNGQPPQTAQPSTSPLTTPHGPALAARLLKDGTADTLEEAQALVAEYEAKYGQQQRSVEGYLQGLRSKLDPTSYAGHQKHFYQWLAEKETAENGGKLRKGRTAPPASAAAAPPVSQSPAQPTAAPAPAALRTPDRAAALRTHQAWARHRLYALSSLPPAERPAARRILAAVERGVAENHALFKGLALGRIARHITGGQGMAVQEIGGKVVLALDLPGLITQFSNIKDVEGGVLASMVEESIHAAVLGLAKLHPERYGFDAFVRQWQRLPAALRLKVWKAYKGVDIQSGTAQKLPARLTKDQQWQMHHEFVRMLVQDKYFAQQISEVAAQDKGLATWLVQLLTDLSASLKKLLGLVSPDLRAELETMVDEIGSVMQSMQQASAEYQDRLSTLRTVDNPQGRAVQHLTDGTLYAALAPNDPAFQESTLAALFDQLPTALQSLAAESRPVPGQKVKKATLMHQLLSALALEPGLAQSLFTTPAATPPKATNILRRLYKRLEAQFSAPPPPSLADLLQATPAEARAALQHLHTQVQGALRNLHDIARGTAPTYTPPAAPEPAPAAPPANSQPPQKPKLDLSTRPEDDEIDLSQSSDTRASVLSASPSPQVSGAAVSKSVKGSNGTAYTDANEPITFEWAVVDVADLNISNRDDGTISPDYPQELQPRDRTSAGSEAQVADIAKNFNLDRLSASSSVGDGAPIIGPDAVVESGNGRVMGGRRAYSQGGQASQAYRAALIARAGEFGLNAEQVEAVKNPVLVRVRTTEVNRVAFVLSANVSTIAPKRELEQAKIDAKQIVPDLFTNFVPSEDGDVFTAANAAFIRDFVSAIIPPAERPAIMDARGNLSQSGLRRLRNALFVHAYGDSADTLAALGTIAEDIEADGRNLVNTLIAIAPRFAEQNGRIASGALYPLSITEDLAKALTTYQEIKARGDTVDSWAAQDTLAGIGERPSDFQRTLVTALHEHRRKPRVLLAALDRYAKAIDGAGDPKQASLFGEEPRPTREELFALATGKTFTQDEAEGWRRLAEAEALANKNRPTGGQTSGAGAVGNVTPAEGSISPVTAASVPQPVPQSSQKSSTPATADVPHPSASPSLPVSGAAVSKSSPAGRPLSTTEAAKAIQAKTGLTDRDALAKELERKLSLRPFAAQSMAEAVLNDLAGIRAPRPAKAPSSYTGPRSVIFGVERRVGPEGVPQQSGSDWMDPAEYKRYGGKGDTSEYRYSAWQPSLAKGRVSVNEAADSIVKNQNMDGWLDTYMANGWSDAEREFPGGGAAITAIIENTPPRQHDRVLMRGVDPRFGEVDGRPLYSFSFSPESARMAGSRLTAKTGPTKYLSAEDIALARIRRDGRSHYAGAQSEVWIPASELSLAKGTTAPAISYNAYPTGNNTQRWQNLTPQEQMAALSPGAQVTIDRAGTATAIPPKNALKLYRTLTAKQATAPLNAGQSKALEQAERSLGQLFLFDDPATSILKPAEDLVLEQETVDMRRPEEQLALFMGARAPSERALLWQAAGLPTKPGKEFTAAVNARTGTPIPTRGKIAADEYDYDTAEAALQRLKLLHRRGFNGRLFMGPSSWYIRLHDNFLDAMAGRAPTHYLTGYKAKYVVAIDPQQPALFMATKRSLYSKAAKEKHLRPITRMLVKLRAGVQDALIRTVAETVLPRMSPPIRALMDQAAAEYDGWLKPKMAALKPQWDAYKKRYTPAIVDAYNEGLESLATELGIMPMTRVPLKGDRGMEKAILDAEDESTREGRTIAPDVTRVNDVLRASLVASDDEGVARAVDALRARYKVVKFKDRFSKPVGGYHDWNFIIEVAPGLNAEVQVHRIDYLFSKELGPGHLMYEDWRRLDRLVKLNAAPEIARQYRRLSKAMEAYYTAIGQAFTIARKEVSSISSPSVSTRPESAMGLSSPARVAISGTGGSPSMSQATGSPFTSKNLVVGENVSGAFTPDTTTQTPNKQGVTITTANIGDYAGAVDVSALQGRQKDWKQAFDWQPGVPVVPLAKLVSHKNELEDPKFKAGLKKDPRQNAADWILKAMQGEPGAKKRAPLDVSANPNGTYTIHDGNATAQALMLAGWKAVPINVVQAPALAKGRTAPNREQRTENSEPDLFSFNTGLGLDTLLTPAQKERKQQDAVQLDLFASLDTTRATTPRAPRPRIRPEATDAPPEVDLFSLPPVSESPSLPVSGAAVSESSPPPSLAPTGSYAAKAAYLSRAIYSELTTDDQPLTWQQLFRMADDAFGGTQADGTYTPKDAYDAVEMAVNRWISERQGFDVTPIPDAELELERAQRAVRALKALTARLPTQSKRTEEMDDLQQFSTVPALAYMAAWSAGIVPTDIMLEPSAGVGGLAAFAKASGASVIANELSPRRASLLRETGIAEQVFEENAEQINNVLPADIRPTVVVMNPPFSTSPTGKKDTANAIKHIESALARLPQGGRLVAIVGEGMALDRPAFRAWWQGMMKKHHVRANVQVNGAEYAKYGTTWDNQLVVIDKVTPPKPETYATKATMMPESGRTYNPLLRQYEMRWDVESADGRTAAPVAASIGEAKAKAEAIWNEGSSNTKPLTGRVESIDELPALLYPIRNERPEISPSLQGEPGAGGPESNVDTPRGSRPGTGTAGGTPDAGLGGTGNLSGGMASAPSDSPDASGLRPDRAGVDQAPPADAVQDGRPGSTPDSGGVAPQQAEIRASEEMTDAVYDAWQPRVLFPGAKAPPTNLAESAAMAAVDPPATSYRPSIPTSYYADPDRGDFDQRLATHALESIALAGNAHQQQIAAPIMPPNEREEWKKRFGTEPPESFRRGFFIGDGTGAGKGRQIAGIMFDNWNQGRKKAVWISEPNLFPDAKRDLNDVANLGDKLFAVNDTKAGEKLARGEGVGFISYSTLRSKEQKPAPGKLAKTRVDQIVEWLGADFDGVIAFDEAHNMGSAMEMKGSRGNKEASQQALAGLELQQRLPNARVVYLSATGATEVSNLAYAERLGLWGPGTPFRDRSKFVAEISAGGVAAMELIAQNLKAMGLYVARSISWHDVSYDRASHALSPDQRQIYDDLAEAWQKVLNNMDEAMKVTGITSTDPETGNEKTNNSAAKSAIRSKFWGGHQRFFNQLITAMKLPTVITAMERELAADRSIVIQLVNTQEASLGRAIDKAAATAADSGEEIDLETLDLSPKDQLLQLVQSAFPVIQMETFVTTDSEGNERTGSRPALDSKGNPILNQEAVAMREALLDKLASTKVPSGPLEILLDHFGADKIAEVTGRTKRVVWKKDKDGRTVRSIEKRSVEHGKREAADFQDGARRILVFSKAGGTGRSFHADRRAKNQQKRVHILLQPGWQASAAVQGFGRTHRNNQVSTPHYLLAETDIVGEKRFMSSIARRLDQLGALTKGQRQTGSQGFFQARDNLESLEAKAALESFYTNVMSGSVPTISPDVLEAQMGLKLRDKEGQPVMDKPPITQFLNRLLSLKLDLQQAVFDAFSERLDAIIETKLSAGTLDLGLENVTALRTVENDRQTVYEDTQSGAKAELVSLTLTQPTKRTSYEGVQRQLADSSAQVYPWARSKRTGKLFALTGMRNVTMRDGSVETAIRATGVTRAEWMPYSAFTKRYDRIQYEREASATMKAEWEQQFEAAPATEDETMQVLTGTMLPIWDKIPGTPRIVRAQTEDGRRMIGRVIPDDMAEKMVSDLTGRTAVITPAKAVEMARNGDRVRLSNGWTFKTARLSGETRYELIGPAYTDHTLLDAAGVMKERIQFNMRYFLPTGKVEEVLAQTLTSFRATIQPEGTPALAKGKVSVDTLNREPRTENREQDRLDRRTARPTRIAGARVSAESGQALRDDHFARLLTGALRPDSPAARSDFDWSPGPRLARLLSEAFSAPILTPAQQAAIQALPVNDEGVESMVYLDRENGVIYKKLKNFAEQPSGGIWPQVTWAGRSLAWSLQPANNPRAVGVRLAVMSDLGGTPTEVAAISPDGHIYLKQPLSSAPNIATDKGSHITVGTRHLAGLVEIPDKHLAPGSARAWLGIVNGRPWLVTDLHPANFIGDNQGDARINDPVIGVISMDVLKNVPGLGAVMQEANRRAQDLGDRANRLFMSNKAVDSRPSTAQTSPMASTDGAAQFNEPSPGGLSEAALNQSIFDKLPDVPNGTVALVKVTGLGKSGGNRVIRHPSGGLIAIVANSSIRWGSWDRTKFRQFDEAAWPFEKNVFVRVSNNADDYSHIKNRTHRGSRNHRDEVDEGGLSVAHSLEHPAKYAYLVTGEIIGEGTDGEPLLDINTVSIVGPTKIYEATQAKIAEAQRNKGIDPDLFFNLASAKPIATIEIESAEFNPSLTSPRAQSGTLAKGSVSPAQPSPSLPVSPLAALGWNHLDRSASAKLAALTRWTNDTTKAGELVAKWQAAPLAAPFMKWGHILKKELFPDSVLPREIAAKKREMEIKTAMGGQRAMDLVRALSGSPKFSDIAYPPEFAANPIWRTRLYSAMTGEAPMSSLPAPLQALAAKLRAMLVEIGQEAVKQGRMSLDTFEMLREGYMPHYYKEDVAREKSLIQRFRLAVRDLLGARTSAWHIVDTQNRDRGTNDFRAVEWQPGKWRFRNREHRDAHYEDFILSQALTQIHAMGGKARNLTVSDLRAPAALSGEVRGALDVIKRQLRTRYQKEAPLSLDAHQKAGLIMDPVYAIARYAAQQAHDNSTAEFFNFVAANPENISDVPAAGFTEVPDNPRYGRLAGKYVTDDVAHQILEMIESPGDALRAYDTILGWWKTGKTVLNPGTHVRNVLGNVFFSQLAGNSVWNPGNTRYYRDALRAMRNGGPDLMEAYEQGVLGADFVSVELRQTLRQLLPDPATIEEGKPVLGIGKAIGQFAAKVIGNPAHKAYNQIAALYQAEDELFKLAAYLKTKSILLSQSPSLPLSESSAQAAAHVRHWFPYFDSGSSTTLRALGRTAMPFLGFYRESIRIFGHALTERPLALAAGLAVPSIITVLSAMALGLDDDELEQVRKDMRGKGGKLLGPTPLGGMPLFSMLLPERSDQGQLQQFDISAIHPFVDFMGNRVEGGENEDWYQKAWRSFIAAGPIGSLIYSQMTGKDTFGDRTFVEQNMTPGEKLAARADNIAKTLLPPLAPGGTGLASLMKAGERSTNKTFETRSPTQTVLRSVVGLDVRNATPNLYRIAEDWRKQNGYEVQEGMDYGSTTPASRARATLFAQLAQDEPNEKAIANIKKRLAEMGHPITSPQDVNKLLFYRDPLKIIGGDQKRGITAKEAQQQFQASLTGLDRETLAAAQAEYAKIKARAPMLLLR